MGRQPRTHGRFSEQNVAKDPAVGHRGSWRIQSAGCFEVTPRYGYHWKYQIPDGGECVSRIIWRRYLV